MNKAEKLKYTKIGRTLNMVLTIDDRYPGSLLTEAQRNWVICSKMAIRELLQGEHEKHAQEAKIVQDMIDLLDSPLTEDEIKKGFDAKAPEEEKEVAGQGELDLDEEEEEDVVEEDAPAPWAGPPSSEWSTSVPAKAALEDGIIQALRDGAGKRKAIDLVMEATKASKFEVEEHWNSLVRSGHIRKQGSNWVTERETDEEAAA